METHEFDVGYYIRNKTQITSTLGPIPTEMRHCLFNLGIGEKIMGQKDRADSTKQVWLQTAFSLWADVVYAADPYSV